MKPNRGSRRSLRWKQRLDEGFYLSLILAVLMSCRTYRSACKESVDNNYILPSSMNVLALAYDIGDCTDEGYDTGLPAFQ